MFLVTKQYKNNSQFIFHRKRSSIAQRENFLLFEVQSKIDIKLDIIIFLFNWYLICK